MGMFSWCCKGCGQEIRMNERARFNGCKGEYDGYGRCGSFDYESEEPVAWHERCYQQVTPEQKLDETPSKYARNQGFGYERLIHLRSYRPGKPVQFYANITHFPANSEIGDYEDYYLTPDGLKDERAFDKRLRESDDEIYFAQLSKSPRGEAKMFDTFEDCRRAAFEAASQFDVYEIIIFGEQKSENRRADGSVFEFIRSREFDLNGMEIIYTGDYIEETRYDAQSELAKDAAQ